MEKKDLISDFKFYKGEPENPFIGKDSDSAMWWEGEKHLYQAVDNDTNMWNRTQKMLEEAIESGNVSGALTDTSIPMEKRVIIFYLDLWHGKWYPYDNLDKIFDYVKA